MAQVTITQLPYAGALTGTEPVPVVQNGVTVQTTTGAISGAGALNYPFLTANTTAGLTQARYLTTNAGLTLTDNGAGQSMRINLIGAALSLNTSGNGIQVKTNGNTVTAVQMAVGSGLTITNPDGTSGNPTVSLGTVLSNVVSLGSSSAQGIVTVNGTSFNSTTITGTSNQITIANGNGVGGSPTVAIANNVVLPGTGGAQMPSGTTGQRLPNNGVIRYNTDTSRFEFYENGVWVNVGNGDGTVTSVTGTANQIVVSNNTTTPVVGLSTNPILPGTAGVVVPQGTTAQRNAGILGELRYNTDIGSFEAYTTAGWGTIISGSAVSSFSAGTTGFTPNTISSGNIVLGGILNGASGGTGVNNGTNTITVGGNITFSGAYTQTFVATGNTSVTLPTSGTLATLANSETFTNKTISGSSNTLTNIGNASLTNSTITVNGTSIALGASGTITAVNPFALTIGTGLTGTSYNGSSAVTIAIDSTVATLTGTQTLTNKTISGSSNTLTNIGNSSLTNSSITLGTTNIALGGTSLAPAGLTSVTVTQDPTTALQLATKQYVDSVAQGLNTKAAVLVATTANITLSGEQTIDGVTTSSSRVLVKNQSLSQNNGIYVSASGAWSRSSDANTWNQLVSAYVFVEEGTLQADTGWVCTVDPGGTLGTTPITWAQFSGAGTYSAGTGLTLTGTQFSITNTAVTAGSYTNANITVNAQGQITLASNGSAGGVTSFQTSLSGLTPSTSTTGAITLAGTLGVSSGGTGQTTASAAFNALSPITSTGDLIIGNGTNSATRLGIGANGYVLTSNGTTASWQASTGGVTSFSAGTTGFTPSTGTTGAVTLSGTLNVANGGTGVTSSSGANSVVLRDSNGNIVWNNEAPGYTNTVTAAGTTTLTASATRYQHFSGTSTQTLKLPDETTIPTAMGYIVDNDSTGNVTVQDSAGNTLATAVPGGAGWIYSLSNASATGNWAGYLLPPGNSATAPLTWGTAGLNMASSYIQGITTLNMSGQLTNTVATGTAPFVVSSTTQVANLNAATAGTATNATNVAATAGSGSTNYLTFVSSATGNVGVNTNSSLTYNYTNNALTAGINGGVF